MVVPTLLTDTPSVESLVEALEVRFLANRDANLHFALLTDFPDATEERCRPTRRCCNSRATASRRSTRVCASREGTPADIFFLFHRPRRWNPRKRAWMGHERKRGKLGDLNALLRGTGRTRFP